MYEGLYEEVVVVVKVVFYLVGGRDSSLWSGCSLGGFLVFVIRFC